MVVHRFVVHDAPLPFIDTHHVYHCTVEVRMTLNFQPNAQAMCKGEALVFLDIERATCLVNSLSSEILLTIVFCSLFIESFKIGI